MEETNGQGTAEKNEDPSEPVTLILRNDIGLVITVQVDKEKLHYKFNSAFTVQGGFEPNSTNSSYDRLVNHCVNNDVPVDEAKAKATEICRLIPETYAEFAVDFYRKNIVRLLGKAVKNLEVQAEVYARSVLDGIPFNREDWPVDYSTSETDPEGLRERALSIYFADIKKDFNEQITDARQEVLQKTARLRLQSMIDFCKEVKKYHDAAKKEFETRPENQTQRGKASLQQRWVAEWLERSKVTYQGMKYAKFKATEDCDGFPQTFFEQFASPDHPTPLKIAEEFVAGLYDTAPSSFKKRGPNKRSGNQVKVRQKRAPKLSTKTKSKAGQKVM